MLLDCLLDKIIARFLQKKTGLDSAQLSHLDLLKKLDEPDAFARLMIFEDLDCVAQCDVISGICNEEEYSIDDNLF